MMRKVPAMQDRQTVGDAHVLQGWLQLVHYRVALLGKLKPGQFWAGMQLELYRYRLELLAHRVHELVLPRHYWQGYWQGRHTLFNGIYPTGHSLTQVFSNRFNTRHAVQLFTVTEHLAQSPSHGTATPDTFTNPSGTCDRHLLPRNTNPRLQEAHCVGEVQFLQPILSC